MFLTVKLNLKPNKKQEEQFWQFAGTARFCYNESLAFWNSYYDAYNTSPKLQDLLSHMQDLKYNHADKAWLLSIPEAVQKQACKDLEAAWKKTFKGLSGKPKFKKKDKCTPSFYQRTDNFKVVDDKHIKITGIKEPVKIGKNNRGLLWLFKDRQPTNPRVTFDGKHWNITLGIDIDVSHIHSDGEDNTGVDLGERKLATFSDGTMYIGVHDDPRVKKELKRLKKLQKIVSRKYENNKQGNTYIKTNNIRKLEKKMRSIHKRIADIRATYLHEVSKDAVIHSKAVCMENLNVRGMMKNKYRAKTIVLQGWHELRSLVEYKCQFYNVGFKLADRFFPSSKKCSRCGSIKHDLGSNEVYMCNHCGLVIDRDLNAAYNLRDLLIQDKCQQAQPA